MSNLGHASSFRDLIVYQKARQLSGDLFTLSAAFPKEEKYSLTDQIRRSSRSVGAQIAEAWAKRRYEKHFVSKLTDADGEQQETQHWIEVAADCGYIDREQSGALIARCAEIGRLLGGMIAKANLFCGHSPRTFREACADYILFPDPCLLSTDS
jgi:four helix bundle protein